MKKWGKRGIAILLILALAVLLLTRCGNDDVISNSNEAINDITVENPAEETENTEQAVDWLEENLENIQQSMLEGDYEEVIDLLLAMQEQLTDDAQYNALLYIAYMGAGNEEAAAALLNNPNLDANDFAEAFLKSMEILKKDNEKMAEDVTEIGIALMEQMLKLGESNPDAYEAVARIGANLQNDNPEDPTIYAIRYLAALAVGDEAATEAILAEAKANGVSEEALKTTAIEYDEDVNLTTVSVNESEEGKTTSTTYNAGGNVVKTEETVDNKNGTVTKTVKNSDGNVIAVALYDKATGNLITKTYYDVKREVVKGIGSNMPKISETLTGEKEVYEYKNGVIKSITGYNADGDKLYYIALTADGKVASAYEYSAGRAEEYNSEMLNVLKFVVRDGDLLSKTIPVIDKNQKVVGKEETSYSYDNPVGLLSGRKEYEYNVNTGYDLTEEWNFSYVFDDNAKGYYDSVSVKEYLADIKSGEYFFDYEKGTVIKGTALKYDNFGNISYSGVADYVDHTFKEEMFDYYLGRDVVQEAVIDESNNYLLKQTVYATDGALLAKRFGYYEGTTLTGEMDVYYNESGQVFMEEIYDNGVIVQGQPSKVVNYYYNDDGRMRAEYTFGHTDEYGDLIYSIPTKSVSYNYVNGVKQTIEAEYNAEGKITTQSANIEYYGTEGEVTKVEFYVAGTSSFLLDVTEEYEYDTDGNLLTTKYYKTEYIEGQRHTELTATEECTYQNGNVTVVKKDTDGNILSTKLTEYIYGINGEVVSETFYQVDSDGNKEEVSSKTYAYDENGNMISYIISEKDTNGNFVEKHYTAEGYNYQDAIYATDAQMKVLDEDITVTEKKYDEDGNQIGYTISEKDTDGNIKTTYYDSESKAYREDIYDTSGKLISVRSLDPEDEDEVTNTVSVTVENTSLASVNIENTSTENKGLESETVENETPEGEASENEAIEDEAAEAEVSEIVTPEYIVPTSETKESEAEESETSEDAAVENAAVAE